MSKLPKNGRIAKRKIQIQNRKLIKKYPWLLPRNVWSDKVPPRYKYEYTELDAMPDGWRIAFGDLLVEDLDKELRRVGIQDKFRVEQLKEKFGQLRLYHNGLTREGEQIIDTYSHLSENICIFCGKYDVPMINEGWMEPECYDCFRKRKIRYFERNNQEFNEEQIKAMYERCSDGEAKMCDSYTIRTYGVGDGYEDKTYDVSETAQKIRDKWERRHKR